MQQKQLETARVQLLCARLLPVESPEAREESSVAVEVNMRCYLKNCVAKFQNPNFSTTRYPTVLNPPTTTQPYTNRNLQQPNPTRITQMSRPKKDMSMVEKEMEFLRAPARYLNTLSEIQDKVSGF